MKITDTKREELTNQARYLFSKIEAIIKSHREANVVPLLATTDLLTAIYKLNQIAIVLDRYYKIEDAPALEIE